MFWLWLLLYGLLFAVPRALAPAAAPLLTPALLAVYWAALLRYLHARGLLRSYGLCRGAGLTARDALLSLPVLLFAALNAAFGAGLLLTAVRERTGSIALPLLAHALINLTGSGTVSAVPQAAACLAVSALCALCARRLLREAA